MNLVGVRESKLGIFKILAFKVLKKYDLYDSILGGDNLVGLNDAISLIHQIMPTFDYFNPHKWQFYN